MKIMICHMKDRKIAEKLKKSTYSPSQTIQLAETHLMHSKKSDTWERAENL